jgi:hypothetical protein
METTDTTSDQTSDDPRRPDRAKHDELGRTNTGRPARSSPREQPAKAVHQEGEQPAEGNTKADDQDLGKGAVEE